MALNTQAIEYLIFDLDDTLFDTHGLLIKPASIEACQAMVEAGLNTSRDACVSKREELLAQSSRQNVYENLVQFFGVRAGTSREKVVSAGFRSFHDRKIKETIQVFSDVFETLKLLKARFPLFLVTLGTPKTQAEKIDLLKIQPFFKKIYFVDVQIFSSKKKIFESILNESKAVPKAFLSIGNRIDSEICDAKALGMQTVLMQHGEHRDLVPQNDLERPDACINRIGELKDLLSLSLRGGP